MDEQPISSENVSMKVLKKLFEDAYLDTFVDKEGDLVVQGRYSYFIEIPNTRRFIRFVACIRPSDQADDTSRPNYANRINKEPIVLRVFADEALLIFDQHGWRPVKYEEVYLKDYAAVDEAREGLDGYFGFYSTGRPHQTLGLSNPGRGSLRGR